MIAPRLTTLLVFVALALGLVACGGSDDDGGDTTAATTTTTGQSAGDDGTQAGAEDRGAEGEGGAEDRSSASGDGSGGGGGGSKDSAEVDLSVDPSRIKGAVVTETGAVQTLEPDTEDHETAQENSYSSIRAFGEEAEGEEATNITFGLVQYLDAKASGDWATACARIYSVLRENLEKNDHSCEETFGALMSRSSQSGREEQAKIDVSSIRRGEENRAFVIYKTPDTLSADMPMYVEDGIWKVGALEAYALRPEQVG